MPLHRTALAQPDIFYACIPSTGNNRGATATPSIIRHFKTMQHLQNIHVQKQQRWLLKEACNNTSTTPWRIWFGKLSSSCHHFDILLVVTCQNHHRHHQHYNYHIVIIIIIIAKPLSQQAFYPNHWLSQSQASVRERWQMVQMRRQFWGLVLLCCSNMSHKTTTFFSSHSTG